jgi:DNA-binding NarL/FixJ family response regulator
MKNQIKIVIADDHPIVRSGLRQAIELDPDLIVVGEANNGEEAVALIEDLKPEIVVLDIDMPKMDGFAAAREISQRRLDVKIIFLTIHSVEDLFHSAMDLGASGYILKDSVITEIVTCLKNVADGHCYVTPSLTSFLIQRRKTNLNFVEKTPSITLLTETELRILKLISDYKSSKDIAAELFIHFRTVENHRNNICRKLDLRGHNALLKFALEHKKEL